MGGMWGGGPVRGSAAGRTGGSMGGLGDAFLRRGVGSAKRRPKGRPHRPASGWIALQRDVAARVGLGEAAERVASPVQTPLPFRVVHDRAAPVR